MQKNTAGKHVALGAVLVLCLSACGTRLDLKDAAVYSVPLPVGVPQTRSMGETMFTKYTCPCYEYYATTDEIRFDGYKPPQEALAGKLVSSTRFHERSIS